MRLPVHFVPRRPDPFARGAPLFETIVDAAYIQAGDYLIGPDGGFFVVCQAPLQAVLSVKVSRLLTFTRVAPPASANAYRGVLATNAVTLLERWPASVAAAEGGLSRADLPPDVAPSGWVALLPASAGSVLRNGDMAVDDLGRKGVVADAETNAYGCKLLVRQAST